jgi:hypothetical protein
MVTNGKNSKSVVARDERGRWLKGYYGAPGRPLGSRNKLSEDFLCDVQQDWDQHGKKIIKIMREKFPEIYFQSILRSNVIAREQLRLSLARLPQLARSLGIVVCNPN